MFFDVIRCDICLCEYENKDKWLNSNIVEAEINFIKIKNNNNNNNNVKQEVEHREYILCEQCTAKFEKMLNFISAEVE